MTLSEQVQLLKSSRHVHDDWYRKNYPEVADLNMDPTLHYLRYGAAMGRNPGRNFDTCFYLSRYPDAAKSSMNPLLHYVLYGSASGYLTTPPNSPEAQKFELAKARLLSLGFTDGPLRDLTDLQANAEDPSTRALAARELALWQMRLKTPTSYNKALFYLKSAREDAKSHYFRCKLAVAELLCYYHLNNQAGGQVCYERAALAGEVSPDLLLAMLNFEANVEARLVLINRVLQHYGISPIKLLADETLLPYDRLTSAMPLDTVEDGPKVTVLIAAYDAADMLPTALRSLQEQTWKNLEIIVVDDCSPSPETTKVVESFAANDSRISLIRMKENGGAYIARNRGLDEATGKYVTLHDADDWSHPKKIETQVKFMEKNPKVMGCTSEQARCQEDLTFGKIRGSGGIIIFNTSSFLWRREPVKEVLGYWDTVRFGADNEFIRRMQKIFGADSFSKISTGPLSFQRESRSSITADPIKGIDGGGNYYGVRKYYFDFQRHHHQTAASLKYENDVDKRPFPVPPMMVNPNHSAFLRNFDTIVCSDFRESSPHLEEIRKVIDECTREGKTIGLAEYNYDDNVSSSLSPSIIEVVSKGKADILVFGEIAKGKKIIKIGSGEASRFAPKLGD